MEPLVRRSHEGNDSSTQHRTPLAKQGGVFGHTKVRGYHPLVAAMSATGDVVHSRLRGGNANAGRGAASFLTETFNRVRTAGATGPLTLRADSGFYNHKVVDACRAADVRYSITAKLYPTVWAPPSSSKPTTAVTPTSRTSSATSNSAWA